MGDIIVQLDVFVEQQECDEAQSLQAPDGINLNSHLDVFYAILRQVSVQQDVCVTLVIATGIARSGWL